MAAAWARALFTLRDFSQFPVVVGWMQRPETTFKFRSNVAAEQQIEQRQAFAQEYQRYRIASGRLPAPWRRPYVL
jgi:hypothetical protein